MTERDLDVKRLAFLPCSFFSSLKTKRKVHKRRRRGERERERKKKRAWCYNKRAARKRRACFAARICVTCLCYG